jgi:hypothetical protein
MSANKLADSQLGLLCAAAQQPDGAIERASDLKGSAAEKTVGKLLRSGLIEEIPPVARCRSSGVMMMQSTGAAHHRPRPRRNRR